MSLAIFLMPTGDFRDELVRWKERIKHEISGQPYTSHPPHMTILNMEVENEKDGVAIVSAFADFNDSIQILINRKDVFWNDTSTGGHTLFFGIEKNDALFSLQKLLAKALQKVKKDAQPPDYLLGNKQLLESFNKFGFPFVGNHWIPHFTISSVKAEKKHPIIVDFLSTTKKYHFIVNQISVWRVDEDEHTLLEEVNF